MEDKEFNLESLLDGIAEDGKTEFLEGMLTKLNRIINNSEYFSKEFLDFTVKGLEEVEKKSNDPTMDVFSNVMLETKRLKDPSSQGVVILILFLNLPICIQRTLWKELDRLIKMGFMMLGTSLKGEEDTKE